MPSKYSAVFVLSDHALDLDELEKAVAHALGQRRGEPDVDNPAAALGFDRGAVPTGHVDAGQLTPYGAVELPYPGCDGIESRPQLLIQPHHVPMRLQLRVVTGAADHVLGVTDCVGVPVTLQTVSVTDPSQTPDNRAHRRDSGLAVLTGGL